MTFREAALRCPFPAAVELIGEKWAFLILRGAFNGLQHFEEFQAGLGIARNILSDRLGKLVAGGILERDARSVGPAQGHLFADDRKGEALLPVVLALRQWGEDWGCGPADVVLADRSTGDRSSRICVLVGRRPRADARGSDLGGSRPRLQAAAAARARPPKKKGRRSRPSSLHCRARLFVVAAARGRTRRSGGGQAKRLGRFAERRQLVRLVLLVDPDPLQAGDDRFLELLRLHRLFGDLAQGDDRVLVAVAVDREVGAAEIWRARWAAKRTRSNRFETLSTQSSTVTRAIRRSVRAIPKGIWDFGKAAPIACREEKSQGKR